MKEEETIVSDATQEKPGFFKRMVDKLDSAMKQKADQASEESCCGGSSSSCCEPEDECCDSDQECCEAGSECCDSDGDKGSKQKCC